MAPHYALGLLRVAAIASLLSGGRAGDAEATARRAGEEDGPWSLGARVDALERRFAAELERMERRLGRCESEAAAARRAAAVSEDKRRLQEDALCRGEGMHTMLATCCPASGDGGHRLLQVEGCSGLPSTCSVRGTPTAVSPPMSAHDPI